MVLPGCCWKCRTHLHPGTVSRGLHQAGPPGCGVDSCSLTRPGWGEEQEGGAVPSLCPPRHLEELGRDPQPGCCHVPGGLGSISICGLSCGREGAVPHGQLSLAPQRQDCPSLGGRCWWPWCYSHAAQCQAATIVGSSGGSSPDRGLHIKTGGRQGPSWPHWSQVTCLRDQSLLTQEWSSRGLRQDKVALVCELAVRTKASFRPQLILPSKRWRPRVSVTVT